MTDQKVSREYVSTGHLPSPRQVQADGRSNPMVNAGAIAATSLVQGESSNEKWKYLADGLSRFAGRDLTLSDETYASASATNHRNRAIANLLASRNRIYWDPAETVDLLVAGNRRIPPSAW